MASSASQSPCPPGSGDVKGGRVVSVAPLIQKRPRSPSPMSSELSSKRAHQGSSAAAAAPGNQQAAAADTPRAASAGSSQSLYTLPTALLARLCDGYLTLQDFVPFARSFRAARQGVLSSQTRKGNLVWRSDPLFLGHPTLKTVWGSKSGLVLLGQKSNDPGANPCTPAVTAEDLKQVANTGAGPSRTTAPAVPVAVAAATQAPAAVLAPRIELLRHLTHLASNGRVDVLGLFATGHLHLYRFEFCTAAELNDLLHPQVVEVVRSGWLSEDMLFRLHQGRDRSWFFRRVQFQQTMLQSIVCPRKGPSSGLTDNFTSLAEIFLPLTDGCASWLEQQYVASCLKNVKAEGVRLYNTLEPERRFFFTIMTAARHADAWRKCRSLHDDLLHGRGCLCPCTCGSAYFSLCKCCTGCKRRQVEKFEAEVAALASHFIGTPPTAVDVAECCSR